jgi:hypothetical protein
MKDFKVLKTLLSVVALGGALTIASVAQATTLNIAGIKWSVGDNGTNAVSGNSISGGFNTAFQEQLVSGASVPFSGNGYGAITGLGLTGNESPYCTSGASCLLTYTFGNFTTGSTNAYVNIYVNDKSNFDPTKLGTSSVSQSDAITSTAFLTLTASNVTLSDLGNGRYAYSALLAPTSSLMGSAPSVGLANWTLTEDPNLFMSLGGIIPNGASAPGYVGGTGSGTYHAVPEPSDLGIMGLGLLMVGLMGLRFRQSRFRRS